MLLHHNENLQTFFDVSKQSTHSSKWAHKHFHSEILEQILGRSAESRGVCLTALQTS